MEIAEIIRDVPKDKIYYQEDSGVIICGDCLEIMPLLPEKCVDLVLTDPPYGLQWRTKTTGLFGKPTPQSIALKDLQRWDKRPDGKCFEEMRRISNEQIIWGGNYFVDNLGAFKSPFVWNKMTGDNDYADGELAWTSLDGTLRIFNHQWCGAFKDSERGAKNVHPTQKPVALMIWCMQKAKSRSGDLVLDPFLGSGTTLVAAKEMGCRGIGIEISREYCEIAKKRLAQGVMF